MILLLAAVAAILLYPVSVLAEKSIFSTSTGKPVTLAKLVERIGDARVVVFGERHNDPDDHTGQRTLLQAMHDGGYKVALGLEMFRAESQPLLDYWIEGKLSEVEFAQVFSQNWNEKYYPVYHPLFYYARQEGIRLVGLNVSAEIPAKVGRDGFSSLNGVEREKLGPITCDVDPKYRELLSRAMGEKKARPEKFNNFCEAQVLWDVSMAGNALKFLNEYPEHKLLVLAGSYHAWKYGIPEQLARQSKIATLVILPSDDPEFNNYKLIADEADIVWSTR